MSANPFDAQIFFFKCTKFSFEEEKKTIGILVCQVWKHWCAVWDVTPSMMMCLTSCIFKIWNGHCCQSLGLTSQLFGFYFFKQWWRIASCCFFGKLPQYSYKSFLYSYRFWYLSSWKLGGVLVASLGGSDIQDKAVPPAPYPVTPPCPSLLGMSHSHFPSTVHFLGHLSHFILGTDVTPSSFVATFHSSVVSGLISFFVACGPNSSLLRAVLAKNVCGGCRKPRSKMRLRLALKIHCVLKPVFLLT